MNDALAEKLKHLPRNPGVYQHKDAEGKVLYVGKAKNLRNRVRSYFHASRSHDGRLAIMIRKIDDVEVIVTDTEAEALEFLVQEIAAHQWKWDRIGKLNGYRAVANRGEIILRLGSGECEAARKQAYT